MANATISGLIGVVKVLLVASLAVPSLFFCNKFFISIENHVARNEIIAGTALSSIFLISLIIYLLFRKTVKELRDPFIYGFAFLCFTGVVGLITGLEYDGKISGFMGEYIKSGEPYFDSPYGAVLLYLDFFILFPLELLMCFYITSRKTYRNVAIYWAAALFHGMMAILLAVSYGKLGVFPTTFLNIFHFIFPIVVGWSHILTAPNIKITANVKPKPIQRRPIDFLLVILSAVSALACFIRALTVLKSPLWISKTYGKIIEPHLVDETPTPFLSSQVLIDFFYYVPLFLITIYGLIKPGCTWLINVVLLLGGGLLQGQLSHILTSIHYNTPQQLKTPENPTSHAIFWAVNLTLLILPQLLVLRVVACPSFFKGDVQKVGGQQRKTSETIQSKAKINIAESSGAKKAPAVAKKQLNSVKKSDAKLSKKAKQH